MKKLRSFTNDYPYTKEQKYKNELEIYKEMKIDDSIKPERIYIKEIKKRKKEIFTEKDYNKPQNIFFIKIDKNITIFGRKLLSILRQENMIPSVNCSLVSDSMFVGILEKYEKTNREIFITYYPLTDGEKKEIFNKIKENSKFDIYHPFIYYDFDTKKESDSPTSGWTLKKNTEKDLYNGEQHIREYTIKFLNNIKPQKNAVMFDPACSTGDFLKAIKEKFPTAKTIGQDLGIDMVECAKPKLDIVYHGDAINSPVQDESVDFLFLRFLNFRVVTTKKAEVLYKSLIKKVKQGGYIICFGHTPVLLALDDLIIDNLKLVSCIGYSQKYNSIFQYYILKKED